MAQSQEPGVLLRQGRAAYEAGEMTEAVRQLQAAARAYGERGERLNQAIALNYLSLSQQQQGEWQAARAAIEDSLGLIGVPDAQAGTDRQRVFAAALTTRGQLQLSLAEAEAAFESWQEAEQVYQRLGDTEGTVGSQLNQALALEALGFYRRACDRLLGGLTGDRLTCDGLAAEEPELREGQQRQLLAAINRQADSPLKAMALRSLGNQLRVLGQLELSDSTLQQGLAVAERIESPQDIALSLLNLGNTYQALSQQAANYNRPSDAEPLADVAVGYYEQAARRSSDPSVMVQAQLNLIQMWVESERESEAVALFPEVRDRLSELPLGKIAIQGRIQLACSLLGCDRLAAQTDEQRLTVDPTASLELLETAVGQAEDLGDLRLKAAAIGRLGTFYEASGDWDRAQEFTEEAIALSGDKPDLVYQWQWQLGRILQARHEQTAVQEADAGAILAYEKAYSVLNGLRGNLASLDSNVQFNFRDRVEPVYRQFIDLLLRGDNPSQAHLKQARQAVEDLQLAELDNFFQDACAERQQVAAEDLDPEAAILHIVVLKDRLEVIASFPGRQDLKYVSNPGITPTRLSGLIEDIRTELDLPGGRTFRIRDLSEELHQWIISPLAEDLKLQEDRQTSSVKNLVFVLDGLLQNLPMSVLYDHNRQHYLIERYAIAVVPGLQLLQSQGEPQVREDLRLLLAGTNEAPSFETEELDNLNYVLTEVEGIGVIARRSTKLTEQSFLQKNVESQVTAIPYNIVHLATHGKFSSDPNNTFLLDYNERIKVQNLDRLLRRSERVGLNAIDLLTLSACQTATGDNRAALGLAGVAIRAGSRSTLASLWNVSDVSTALLMQEFYHLFLETDLTKAEALREAQLKFIRAELEVSAQASLSQNSLPRPHYWAPFILIGNWL
ncbi:MAG: CHAT domain-containing protein [Phormidium sp. BM_Day4_Bin.17]|nr:CHAT domain-containing protein [Phormidium sp. BM_Day4_Bin.17]UCJ13637.1 MAG: CHAT domain-containing protein [Phormidium sp. PBR-2020]